MILLDLLAELLEVTHEGGAALDRAGGTSLVGRTLLASQGSFAVEVLLLKGVFDLVAYTLLFLLQMSKFGLYSSTDVGIYGELAVMRDFRRGFVVHELVDDIFGELPGMRRAELARVRVDIRAARCLA